MRIVRGWHRTTFYLAHQSNINELMTSQGGDTSISGNTEVCHNLVSDVRINSREEGVLSPAIYNSVKTMENKKKETFTYHCQHVTMIDQEIFM
mgnify:CR=1 FL=1